MNRSKYFVLNRTNKAGAHRANRRKIGTALMLAGALMAGAAHADVAVYSELQGWVSSTGKGPETDPINNMYTGNEDGKGHNSYAAFYIPAGTYTSVTLQLHPVTYGSLSSAVVGIYDVSTPLDGFLNTTNFGTDVYKDLGSGRQYAAVTLSDQTVSVKLNANAVHDINASSGAVFFIGFTNETLNAPGVDINVDSGIYPDGVGRGRPAIEMDLGQTLAVPEPATWASLLAGLGMLGGVALRRRREG